LKQLSNMKQHSKAAAAAGMDLHQAAGADTHGLLQEDEAAGARRAAALDVQLR
jgi:hypothetical protein